jgi:hypothetical protein
MEFTSVVHPTWADRDHTVINVLVSFGGLGEVPFTASAQDTTPHGQEIWARAIAGEFGEVAPYVAPPESEPEVPQTVTRAQGKAALIQAGLWPAVQAYVQGIADPTQQALAEVALHDTLEWHRSSPFLGAAAAQLGLTDDDLDDLFRAAGTIEL